MINVYPNYYKDFKCTADKCRHSCCKGWEIDIDEPSVERFMNTGGEIGEKIKRSISFDGDAHFILGEDERCPFLTESGLCELILSCGEDFLCQICTDHPRFRSFLPGRTETGLGLCCEAAAKLILSQTDTFKLIVEGEERKTPATEALIYLRDELLCIAQDRSMSLKAREAEILRLCDCDVPEPNMEKFEELLLSLERMDDEWTEILTRLPKADKAELPDGAEYEKLLCYFIYRHFFESYEDSDISSKAAFAVMATEFIRYAVSKGEELINTVRLFSAEIEYSDENMDEIYSFLSL